MVSESTMNYTLFEIGLFYRLLMGKEVMSIEDSCYLLTKQNGGNIGISFQMQENQGVHLKSHIDSFWIFFRTAMFL